MLCRMRLSKKSMTLWKIDIFEGVDAGKTVRKIRTHPPCKGRVTTR